MLEKDHFSLYMLCLFLMVERCQVVHLTTIKIFKTFLKKSISKIFLKHRSYNYSIDLQEIIQWILGPIYTLSQNILVALKKYIDKKLAKNFICYSKSSTKNSILFVMNNDKSLQINIDYWGFNKISIKITT